MMTSAGPGWALDHDVNGVQAYTHLSHQQAAFFRNNALVIFGENESGLSNVDQLSILLF